MLAVVAVVVTQAAVQAVVLVLVLVVVLPMDQAHLSLIEDQAAVVVLERLEQVVMDHPVLCASDMQILLI
jgi:hypothetical protein